MNLSNCPATNCWYVYVCVREGKDWNKESTRHSPCMAVFFAYKREKRKGGREGGVMTRTVQLATTTCSTGSAVAEALAAARPSTPIAASMSWRGWGCGDGLTSCASRASLSVRPLAPSKRLLGRLFDLVSESSSFLLVGPLLGASPALASTSCRGCLCGCRERW